jgi:hypothetical protein
MSKPKDNPDLVQPPPGLLTRPVATSQRHPNTYKQKVPDRIQKTIAGFIIWIALLAWSMSAFLEHIDAAMGDSPYKSLARIGAAGAELILLHLIILKIWNKHLSVRTWALVGSFLVGGVILLHSGTLRSVGQAAHEQEKAEKSFTEGAGRIVGQNSAATATAAAELQKKMKADGFSQRERMAAANNLRNAAGQGVGKGLEEYKAFIAEGNKKVYESSIFPEWYTRQYLYIGVFILSLLVYSGVMLLWQYAGPDDVDANFDGVPDVQQYGQPPYQGAVYPPAQYPMFAPPVGVQYSLDNGATWIQPQEPTRNRPGFMAPKDETEAPKSTPSRNQ